MQMIPAGIQKAVKEDLLSSAKINILQLHCTHPVNPDFTLKRNVIEIKSTKKKIQHQ